MSGFVRPTVHSAVIHVWKTRREQESCGSEFRASPGGDIKISASGREGAWQSLESEGFGGMFGVRRPLRFLAYKLELDEAQVTRLAQILDELKTERAQAAVDDRRTLSAFADAMAGASFDAARAGEG